MVYQITQTTKKITYICDVCKEGQMIFNKRATRDSELKILWQHACDKCNSLQLLDLRYPMLMGKDNLININDVTFINE